ncbi:MAG: trypsin-like peptidase domain-containing protein [Lentisphaeria bacterium]|nr:trypsin-like peptidase domain-containing protein [Lentisphaeria bacterium]
MATTSVDGMRSYGTAFAVTNRDFITNKHVIAESIGQKISIYHPKWENSDSSLVARSVVLKAVSSDYDLAWLQLEYADSSIHPLAVFCGKVMQGEEVYTLGYPAYTLGNSKTVIPEITYDKGVIKAVNRIVNNNDCYEMSATINGGNSGGPLFNLNGQVIGVNTFGYDNYENCFFAIKIKLVEKAFPELWEKMNKVDYQ